MYGYCGGLGPPGSMGGEKCPPAGPSYRTPVCDGSPQCSFRLNSRGGLEKLGAGEPQGGGGPVTGHVAPRAEWGKPGLGARPRSGPDS